MKEKLKTIENIAELLYAELKSCINSNSLGDTEKDNNAWYLLKEAVVDAVDVKRKIEVARSWIIAAKQEEKR